MNLEGSIVYLGSWITNETQRILRRKNACKPELLPLSTSRCESYRKKSELMMCKKILIQPVLSEAVVIRRRWRLLQEIKGQSQLAMLRTMPELNSGPAKGVCLSIQEKTSYRAGDWRKKRLLHLFKHVYVLETLKFTKLITVQSKQRWALNNIERSMEVASYL